MPARAAGEQQLEDDEDDQRRVHADADAEDGEQRHRPGEQPHERVAGRRRRRRGNNAILQRHRTSSPSIPSIPPAFGPPPAEELVVHQQRRDRLAVVDLAAADHVDRLVERRGLQLDLLALLQRLLLLLEIVGGEGVHLLAEDARRGEEVPSGFSRPAR